MTRVLQDSIVDELIVVKQIERGKTMDNSYGATPRRGSGIGVGLLVLAVVVGAAILLFVEFIPAPHHEEKIEAPQVPTLEGIQLEQGGAANEGFSVAEQAGNTTEGIDLLGPQSPLVMTFDDLPVSPEESFSQIAPRVREAIQQEDPEMLDWDRDLFQQDDMMDFLFDEQGAPREGVNTRWHGWFVKWVLKFHPEWVSSDSVSVAPAVTYWTIYLLMRAHVPNEQIVGAAPWEWPEGPPAWLK